MRISPRWRTVEEVQTVTEHADITDAEPRRTPYGGRQQWRPECVEVRWHRFRAGGGDWSPWTCDGGGVSGPKVKKDGTDGAQRAHDRFWTYGGRPIDTGIADVDDWANGTRPADSPPEPFGDPKDGSTT
jgi:hypothetical protein